MTGTGPGAGYDAVAIGTTAVSRRDPSVSVVSLGPLGYARQTPHGVSTITPAGTAWSPGKEYSFAVDPGTGKVSYSNVAIGAPGKFGVPSASRGPSTSGLASFFSSLLGPVTTTPAPAIGPEAVSFGPGSTTGPMGFSPGGAIGGAGFGNMGFGVGFGGFGGAHSNSSDSRGLYWQKTP